MRQLILALVATQLTCGSALAVEPPVPETQAEAISQLAGMAVYNKNCKGFEPLPDYINKYRIL